MNERVNEEGRAKDFLTDQMERVQIDQEGDRVKADAVNHPLHYCSHPSGVECIEITKHMNFCLGNVMKYVWRCGLKEDEIKDLEKARQYLNIEIDRRIREREAK